MHAPDCASHCTAARCTDHIRAAEPPHALACVQEQFADAEVRPCELCHLRNDHTADVALPRPALEGPCAKYSDNACCTPKTATAIETSEDLYNVVRLPRWDPGRTTLLRRVCRRCWPG